VGKSQEIWRSWPYTSKAAVNGCRCGVQRQLEFLENICRFFSMAARDELIITHVAAGLPSLAC